MKISAGCFGVAGAVMNGTVSVTKLPWYLNELSLQKELNIDKVTLINDLVATAYGIPVIDDMDLFTIHQGEEDTVGAKAVLAPGTGLGEAFLLWDGQSYKAYPSEGGHTLFAPMNKVQRELLAFLSKSYDTVSFDMICSGRGLPLIYDFVKNGLDEEEPQWLTKELLTAQDPTPVLMSSALREDDPVPACQKMLDIFIDILAAEASNHSLKTLATGGVFIGGGIPPRLLQYLDKKRFHKSFTGNGPLKNILKNIPIKIICNPKAAVLGAANFAITQILPKRKVQFK